MKEIERKYKIYNKSDSKGLNVDKELLEKILLQKGVKIAKFDIVQYYLTDDETGIERRIRSMQYENSIRYFITLKGIPDPIKGLLSRDELEEVITKDQFNSLIDEATHILHKERWILSDNISIDFINVSKDNTLAIFEIEFPNETTALLIDVYSIYDFVNTADHHPFYVLDVTSFEKYRSKNLSSPLK